jgi:hypothetical protein
VLGIFRRRYRIVIEIHHLDENGKVLNVAVHPLAGAWRTPWGAERAQRYISHALLVTRIDAHKMAGVNINTSSRIVRVEDLPPWEEGPVGGRLLRVLAAPWLAYQSIAWARQMGRRERNEERVKQILTSSGERS